MATAVPALETVIDALYTALVAINPSVGTVRKGEHTLEDDVEHIEVNSLISGGSLDVWFIDLESTSPYEGKGVGEDYDIYNLRLRYWSMRTADADWSSKARIKAQSVADALTRNPAIFAIGTQVQIFTPELVAIVSHGPAQIRDVARSQGQMIFETILALAVEARRWS
jgi:hypothetical protein